MNNLLNQVEGGNLGRPIVDPIPQICRRPIIDDDSDDELNFGADPMNPSMGRFERKRNFNYYRNDDEEQGKGIDPIRPNFNHIRNIRNKIRSIAGFYDTSDEEATLVNLQIHVVDKEVEDSGNQTTEEAKNTN